MKNLLCGKEIVKSFGEGNEKTRVLNQVSLEVERGEYLSVMGPSGSGKSTLLYALSGMDIIDSGSVSLDGLELSGLEDEELSDLRRRKMGFVFQQPALLRNLNILDNIILPMMRDNRKQVGTLVQKAKTDEAVRHRGSGRKGDYPDVRRAAPARGHMPGTHGGSRYYLRG